MPVWDLTAAAWVGDRLPGGERGFGACQALRVEHNGATVAGIVFHDWSPETGVIEVSMAADDRRWMTRTVINEAMAYVFDLAKCQMLVSRQKAENTPARRVMKALGGTEITVPRLFGKDCDGTIITITDDAWRSSRFRKRSSKSCPS